MLFHQNGEADMTYQIGAKVNLPKHFSGKTGIVDTKNFLTGFRAFARVEKTGEYFEVFGISQEDGWVDGTNEGFWFHHTHETREDAEKCAWKAYRWLNRKQNQVAA